MDDQIVKIMQQTGYNKPATEEQIRICCAKLKMRHLPEIPSEFCEILKKANGFSNEGALVFGAETKENHFFKDLAEYNLKFFKENTSTVLVLGYDESFYLIYESKTKQYQIVDSDSFEVEFYSFAPYPALESFLKTES